jgi:hypothetical protein
MARNWREGRTIGNQYVIEIRIVGEMNEYLNKFRIYCHRKEDQYSPADVSFRNMDTNKTLVHGDLEDKSEWGPFPLNDIPRRWTRGARFLNRKVAGNKFKDEDVYILHDGCGGYIWATFGDVRKYGHVDKDIPAMGDTQEAWTFWVMPKKYLRYGIESLAKYLETRDA